MPVTISVRADLSRLQRQLSELERKQLPFASAQALTAVARRVQAEETKALSTIFDRPTPFTQRAFGVVPARKATLQAVVFAKDIQAAYLAPHEFGGRQVLGTKRAILTPKKLTVNAYGNIPKGAVRRLKGRANVYVGTIKTKSGETIGGVWQRPTNAARRKGKGSLKLLVRFTDPLPVAPTLHYRDRAKRIVQQHFAAEMAAALAKALRTARR